MLIAVCGVKFRTQFVAGAVQNGDVKKYVGKF